MKLGVTLDILNQKDTPAFYADTLANRPAAGFTGRVFISTDTLDLYRDTGTTWVLLSPSSTGTITGSGAAGQVTYFSAASSITGSNDLFFDSVNGHLGIGTITPSTALTIFHDQNQIIQINQTTATNDTKIAFQNSGTPLWRIGNSYNAGANDYAIYDVVGAIQPLTIKKTSGQVLIGTTTIGSGKLVVASSTGDNGIQIVGATAPSLRIDSAESGPTKRIGLGIATAVNNFIQGSADRDMCIFNGSTTASPMLFGIYDTTNVQEAARISAARNFLIGTTTDNGNKLQVNGSSFFNSNLIVQAPASTLFMSLRGRSSDNFGFIGFYDNTGTTRYGYIQSHSANGGQLNITMDGGAQIIGDNRGLLLQPAGGKTGIGTTAPLGIFEVLGDGVSYFTRGTKSILLNPNVVGANTNALIDTSSGMALDFQTAGTFAARISTSQNLLIGTTTDGGYKLRVVGESSFQSISAVVSGASSSKHGYVAYTNQDNGVVVNLTSIFPKVSFSGNFISLQLQIVSTDGGFVNSSIINCARDFTTTWSYVLVSSVGTANVLVLTFGGTSAAPTLQINGTSGSIMSVTYNLIAR